MNSQILPDTEATINGEIVSIPQVAPVEEHSGEKSICATHGIINGNIYRITERGNHAYDLSNGKNYWKDNTKNDVKVVWVRMIVTNYDNVEYSTH